MRYGSPINADVVVVVEPEEFLPQELCAIVGYDGVGMKFRPVLRAHEEAGRVRSMELEIRLASA